MVAGGVVVDVGGVVVDVVVPLWLETLIESGDDVAKLSAASRATALTVCVPSELDAVFQSAV
jgi:hypothetical protein